MDRYGVRGGLGGGESDEAGGVVFINEEGFGRTDILADLAQCLMSCMGNYVVGSLVVSVWMLW